MHAKLPCRAVVVMDGDGEDSPSDIPRLLSQMEKERCGKIVFADRTKRSETWLFRAFYMLYRLLHFVLTGVTVRVGNFSVVPYPLLTKLVAASELWNHYAASVYKNRLPFSTVPTVRANRLAAESRMNFVSLVTHGLSAISVFGDRVGVRMLTVAAILMVVSLSGLAITVVLRLTTSLAIPGWATYTSGILLIMFFQMSMLFLGFVFMILQGRDNSRFLPFRDYIDFIADTQRLYGRNE